MTPYEKIRAEKRFFHWENKSSLAVLERMSISLCSHGQQASGWDAIHCVMRHMIGTAAGVMRSRAARRLQEPARWVLEALNAMLFTPRSPHLNLPGRPRLQRPAYEEPVEAGTLPRFIEIPTPPTKNPKSETATSTPDDTRQSTKRRRQEITFQEPLQTTSSAGAAAGTATDSSMVFPGPKIPRRNLHVRCLPQKERTVSKKRQRPTEVNTVLAFAGGDSRNEISTLTEDQKALHTAKVNEIRNMDNFGVVEVVDRP